MGIFSGSSPFDQDVGKKIVPLLFLEYRAGYFIIDIWTSFYFQL